MSYAVNTLASHPSVALYVDADPRAGSAPTPHGRPPQRGRCEQGARGFSLNTANFFTTSEEIGFGETISDLTGGAHYVIDTSRNGAGPATDTALDWCNPGGRAMGAAPTTATAGAHADAYLWVKRPGESDGSCNRGEPGAGTFVNSYAIQLVRNAGS